MDFKLHLYRAAGATKVPACSETSTRLQRLWQSIEYHLRTFWLEPDLATSRNLDGVDAAQPCARLLTGSYKSTA